MRAMASRVLLGQGRVLLTTMLVLGYLPCKAMCETGDCRQQEFKDRAGNCVLCKQCGPGMELSKVKESVAADHGHERFDICNLTDKMYRVRENHSLPTHVQENGLRRPLPTAEIHSVMVTPNQNELTS
ncbi:hypothetical protein U0070_010845 [Myodes glareolus]|uniref:TNFR-Cys domain-containing protein n=1 Tax=Myodes glareolus TaxID=447135 RepID=A0AAW0I386_MYOGA